MTQTPPAVQPVHLNESEPAALYHHYPEQTAAQPVHITLDLQTGGLSADWTEADAMPMSVWTGCTRWYSTPAIPTATTANQMLDELTPLAQRVLNGAEIVWDGQNNVGRLGDAAAAAEAEIIDALATRWADAGMVEEHDLSVYADAEDSPAQAATDLSITPDSTDDDLARGEEALRSWIEPSTPGGYIVLRDVGEYLTQLRAAARDAVRERLAEVAESHRALETERNALITRMVAWGEPTRTVGEAAGLSHGAVQRIAARTSRGGDDDTDAT